MTLKDEIDIVKTKCGTIALGNGRCWICGCMKSKRGMVIHHLWYLLKGDVRYNDPKYLPHNDSNNLKYHNDLLPLIIKNPKRFMYLCTTHHFALEKLCRYGNIILNKLITARRMTKT